MDVPAAYGLGGRPFWLVITALLVIVLARSHGTYWLARGAANGASLGAARLRPGRLATARARVETWSTTPVARRALASLRRLGPVAVMLAYLTVGAQTAVFAAAGVSRMSYVKFTAASLPGALAWAFIWGTVGLGAVWGTVALAATSPWGLAAGLAAGVTLAVLARARRRASGGARGSTSAPDPGHSRSASPVSQTP